MGKSTRVVSKSTRVVGKKYPIPAFFDPQKVGEVWRVPYEERAAQAKAWALQQKITPASEDRRKIALLLIDVQNTFCTENFELVVGGAVEDNRRLVRFIYENLGKITEIIPTLDTHKAAQIFHACFWVNAQGEHPPAMTPILLDEVLEGKWKVNPHLTLATQFHQGIQELQNYANHYVKKLTKDGKYPLMIWPYHALLGGLGHCLVSSVEEACFFHQMVRHCPTRFELKGENPLTENYSILQAEVLKDARGKQIAKKNDALLTHLLEECDAVLIAGQAKSHCVAWTIDHLLSEIQQRDPALADRIYLLEDATSPVVVPGIVDFTPQADEAYQRFQKAGMHLVRTTEALEKWQGSIFKE